MKLTTRILAGLAGTMLLTTGWAATSMAADAPIVIPAPPPAPPPVPLPPVAAFSGPYVGGIVGIGHGDKLWDNTPYGPWGTTEHAVSGLLAGVEAGYRFQTGNFVFGVEGDWAWTNINGASDCG